MKKLLLIAIALLIPAMAFAQFQPVIDYSPHHTKPLTVTVQVTSGNQTVIDKDSIWVQFPEKFSLAGSAKIDTLTASETIAASGWGTNRDCLFSGYCEVNIKITNVDLATDSLQVIAYALDRDGDVVSNDYVYLDFSTPPTYKTAANILSWTTATLYRASCTGAFGFGTYGLLFVVNSNDVTASKTGSMVFEVFVR